MLDKYINEARAKILNGIATAEDRERFAYAQSYRRGEEGLKAFRDRLIAKEINASYDKDAQLAILFNKDTEPSEYESYQNFRITAKAKADKRMAELKAELEETIEQLNSENVSYSAVQTPASSNLFDDEGENYIEREDGK